MPSSLGWSVFCKATCLKPLFALSQGRGIGRNLVARTIDYLKEEQIGNICLFADADGKLAYGGTPDRATCECLQLCALFMCAQLFTFDLFGKFLSCSDELLTCMMSFLQRWGSTSSLDSEQIQMA